MKVTLALHLKPTVEQSLALTETVIRFNSACSTVSGLALSHGLRRAFDIQKVAYYPTREQFGLSADMTIRVIKQVADAFKVVKVGGRPEFRPAAAVPFQTGGRRDVRFLLSDRAVQIATVLGWKRIPFRCPEKHLRQLSHLKGQADLVCRNGRWLLLACVEVEEETEFVPHGWVGVDLGIVNIATASTGPEFGGGAVEKRRKKAQRTRTTYQRRDTRNSRRRLRKLSGRQARFQKDTNHTISKAIVGNAKALRCGIVLEDLTDIRDRTERTATKAHRRRLGNWSFSQLRSFIQYKARLLGVPVWMVDPRNTSRTCFACGHCDKRNRRSQSEFSCTKCGFAASADRNAACNLARLGANQSTALIEQRPRQTTRPGCNSSP